MNYTILKKLHLEGLLGSKSFEKIIQEEGKPLVSVFWDINTLLGLGVLALSSGLGILIYENIDSIGHTTILTTIAIISIACFVYCSSRKPVFSIVKAPDAGHFFDYILLLGTLTMLTFCAYLQFQYQVFGSHYGLATFLPMLALFFIAYFFDHIGILNLAILNLGLWMGVSLSPKELLTANTYNDATIIYTYLLLGFILLLVAFLSARFQFKPHFKFSYEHYGVHVSFLALLAAYAYHYDANVSFLWLAGMIALAFLLYKNAAENHSFYFSLLAILYGYIAVSCLIQRLFSTFNDGGTLILMALYFPVSASAFVYVLIKLNQKIKAS
jgi:hypothetical protein